MHKKFAYFHLIPFFIACGIAICYLSLKNATLQALHTEIEGNQTALSGKFGNLTAGQAAEVNYLASIKNKNQFTIFGSSEFSNSAFCPYNFFPDSLGIEMIGIGHAYHQSLSIFIELLAANEFLDSDSKLCILLSPGWFTTGAGTNSEAFLEFARPNLLAKIIQDQTLKDEYKLYLGEYITRKSDEFTNFSNEMEYLAYRYKTSAANPLNKTIITLDRKIKKVLNPKKNLKTIEYKIGLADSKLTRRTMLSDRFDSIGITLKNKFLSEIKSNPFYVNDTYYNAHLKKDNKAFQPVDLVPANMVQNHELADLKLLIDYLSAKEVQASFVLIPYNAYCYNNIAANQALVDSLKSLISDHGFPFLNMYPTSREDYEPGILLDVMHLGDYGWMKVNKFIFKTYYHDQVK